MKKLLISLSAILVLLNGGNPSSPEPNSNIQMTSQDKLDSHVTKLEKACNGGDVEGCRLLGWKYYSYGRSEIYSSKYHILFTKACSGGDVEGCCYLGNMYEQGDGVKQDYSKAFNLYTKACNGGFASGCTYLGEMYEFGRGVKQDNSKAINLYTKACEGDDGVGCQSLYLLTTDETM